MVILEKKNVKSRRFGSSVHTSSVRLAEVNRKFKTKQTKCTTRMRYIDKV